jgi:hypothetical protein
MWVVDGQQRIASLARLLLAGEPSLDAFATYFDLDTDAFVPARRAKSDKDPGRFVPLTEVLDSVKLQLWVSAHGLDERRMKVAFRLGSRIREYSIPTYVVETSNEQVLREMFGRLNSSGKPLTSAEVFNALHGVRGTETVRDLRDLSAALSSLEFGELEESLVYRAMLAILGRDVVGTGVPRLAETEAARAFEQTTVALSKAITFLRRDAGIPNEALLPYRQPLVVLAKFFHLHADPRPRTRELLSRWLWRGAWTARHAGDVVSTRRVLDLISADEANTVQSLLGEVGREKPSFALETFNFRHAHSKLEVLALLELHPRHVANSTELSTAAFGGADWLVRIVDDVNPAARTIASRVIHPPLPGILDAIRVSDDHAFLASHEIGLEAHAALVNGDVPQFLTKRAGDLTLRIQKFLEARAKFEANDRPSLDSLVVSDEED